MHIVTVRDRQKQSHQIEIAHVDTAAQATASALASFPGGEVLGVEPPDEVAERCEGNSPAREADAKAAPDFAVIAAANTLSLAAQEPVHE